MNVAYINPFVSAARKLFETMVRLPLTTGHPYLLRGPCRASRISAVLHLTGAASGLVVLAFPEPTALALASALAGAPIGKFDADCFDALGEMANMVAGDAKKDLPGGLVKLSTPRILRTPEQPPYPARTPVIAIPAQTDAGAFTIEIAFHTQPVPAPAVSSAAA